MFRALLAHLQEALHKQQLVFCVRDMSVGCYQGWNGAIAANRHNTHAKYQYQVHSCTYNPENIYYKILKILSDTVSYAMRKGLNMATPRSRNM
jgi:hypothetical protein